MLSIGTFPSGLPEDQWVAIDDKGHLVFRKSGDAAVSFRLAVPPGKEKDGIDDMSRLARAAHVWQDWCKHNGLAALSSWGDDFAWLVETRGRGSLGAMIPAGREDYLVNPDAIKLLYKGQPV